MVVSRCKLSNTTLNLNSGVYCFRFSAIVSGSFPAYPRVYFSGSSPLFVLFNQKKPTQAGPGTESTSDQYVRDEFFSEACLHAAMPSLVGTSDHCLALQ